MSFNLAEYGDQRYRGFISTSFILFLGKKGADCLGTHTARTHLFFFALEVLVGSSYGSSSLLQPSCYMSPYLSATAPVRVAIHRGRGSGAGFV